LDVYPGIGRLLADLKKDFRLVALTNTNMIHEKVWKVKYKDTLSVFEQIFSSPHMGTRKPESTAYQMVLDNLNIKAEQALFLDDNPENTKGAERVGIDAILVRSQMQMREDLIVRID